MDIVTTAAWPLPCWFGFSDPEVTIFGQEGGLLSNKLMLICSVDICDISHFF